MRRASLLSSYHAHLREMVAAEKSGDKPTLHMPPPPRRYHWSLLALAHSIFEASGTYIVNPRSMSASLFDADTDWLADFANYRKALQFHRDYDKRPPELT